MKETRTINLNGLVYNIDFDAYQDLRDYLQDIELRLPMDEKSDVLSDIEARMAELFQKALFARNAQVINRDMVNTVKAQIGAPAEFGENKRPKIKKSPSSQAGCGRTIGITVIVLLALIAIPLLIPVLFAFFGVTVGLLAAGVGVMSVVPVVGMELFGGDAWWIALGAVCVLTAVIVPVVMLVHTIVAYMRTRRAPKARFWWITLIIWLLSLVGVACVMVKAAHTTGGTRQLIQTLQRVADDDYEYLFAETRTLPAFHSIEVEGAASVTLQTAPEPLLSVACNEPAAITSEVRDSVLYLRIPSERYEGAELTVCVPELRRLRATGACKVENEGVLSQPALVLECTGAVSTDLHLAVQHLTVTAQGATELELEGSAQTADITLSGAGKINADDLSVQDMRINCKGASYAELYVLRTLWAQAAGASKIVYKGTPAVKQSLSVGGSQISKH